MLPKSVCSEAGVMVSTKAAMCRCQMRVRHGAISQLGCCVSSSCKPVQAIVTSCILYWPVTEHTAYV